MTETVGLYVVKLELSLRDLSFDTEPTATNHTGALLLKTTRPTNNLILIIDSRIQKITRISGFKPLFILLPPLTLIVIIIFFSHLYYYKRLFPI
jgi:hypothetical protein